MMMGMVDAWYGAAAAAADGAMHASIFNQLLLLQEKEGKNVVNESL